ncbi:bacteriohemerythrin [Desulfurococcus amylolyticus]|uniref:Hemerythrin-like metal-binding protein n=1 Tax=Desulfurococcus amylolyticus DSM 16532 TaxID=768672 RepID=I3XS90_DESAM|nr:hemerythrin family protein [Desulfurococcus amylolyticus]AFL66814.1 hemerythrin-like metal-binding protein [Desulfurococcus amylolyticus DSM 16532]
MKSIVIREDIENLQKLIPLSKLLDILEVEIIESIMLEGGGKILLEVVGRYASENEYYMAHIINQEGTSCMLLMSGNTILNGECRRPDGGEIPVNPELIKGLLYSSNVRKLDMYRVKSPFVMWSEKYNLGVKPLDIAHRNMFEKFNTVIKYILNGELGKIQEAFREVYNAVITHFELEEKLQDECKYDKRKRESHVKRHLEFKMLMDKLASTSDASQFVKLLRDLYTYIASYLDYMLKDDMELAEHLKKCLEKAGE